MSNLRTCYVCGGSGKRRFGQGPCMTCGGRRVLTEREYADVTAKVHDRLASSIRYVPADSLSPRTETADGLAAKRKEVGRKKND